MVSQLANAATVVSMPDSGQPRGRWILWASALFVVTLVSGTRAFFLERHQHNELRAQLAPRLGIVFKNGEPPYEESSAHGEWRVFRLGIGNSGAQSTNVAVKLTRIYPAVSGIPLMKELQRTYATEGESRFDVNKSEEPLEFVGFIRQELYSTDGQTSGSVDGKPWVRVFKKGETRTLELLFAQGGERRLPTDRDQYLLWVAIAGDGAGPVRKFALVRNEKGQYDLSIPLFG